MRLMIFCFILFCSCAKEELPQPKEGAPCTCQYEQILTEAGIDYVLKTDSKPLEWWQAQWSWVYCGIDTTEVIPLGGSDELRNKLTCN